MSVNEPPAGGVTTAQTAPSGTGSSWFDQALRVTCYAGIVLALVVIERGGRDGFRVPKELVVRGAAIVLAAVFAIGLVLRSVSWPSAETFRKPQWLLCCVLSGWTVITGITAENRAVVPAALAWLAALIVIFVAACRVAKQTTSFGLAVAATTGVVINAVVLVLQALRIWNPFAPLTGDRLTLIALLGNPDDAGGVFVPAAVLTVALAVVTRSPLAIGAAALVIAALVASQTVTAIVALVVALAAVAFVATRRKVVVLLVVAAVGIATLSYPPVLSRFQEAMRQGSAGNLNDMLSSRLTAFAAAREMFLRHPLTGVGPGNFGWAYYDYKIISEVRYPSLGASSSRVTNYAQAHSDHLEILAETGLPGYLIFLTVLILIGRISLRPRTPDPRQQLARLMAFPLVVGLFISALTHFPLQLASSTMLYVVLAAGCLSWSES